jgi:hypothetical protein
MRKPIEGTVEKPAPKKKKVVKKKAPEPEPEQPPLSDYEDDPLA